MICPKCGRPVTEAAVICPGCDFILDTGFLGEEILDEEKTLRPGRGGVDPAMFNLADAVILGDIDDTAQSFETSDSGFHVRESTGARLYVSGRSQAMLAPDAIPAVIKAATEGGVRLTPFERHVLTFIDGARPVETIRQIAGLDEAEVKTALATLADKGVVEVVGRALVELGVALPQGLPRRPQNRAMLRRQIAGAFGPVEDDADLALDEAFRTQTGLSPLNASDLAPSDEDDDGDVFSNEGSDESDLLTAPRELRSLASSSTPVKAIDRSHRTASFAPVSRTADPSPLSNDSDGFDEFGGAGAFGATQRVSLRSLGSSSDLSSPAGDLASPTGPNPSSQLPSTQLPRGAADVAVRAASQRDALAELSELDDDSELPGMGSTAIARLANSAIGFSVASRAGARKDARTSASIRIDEQRSRQALSELVDDDSDPFSSLADAPALPSEPRPPFMSSSANSSVEASQDGDEFSGDEYSDDGEPAAGLVRQPTAMVPVERERGATDSLLSALADVPGEDDVAPPRERSLPPASAVFATAPIVDDGRPVARPTTMPSLAVSARDPQSSLLGSSLMRSAAEVSLESPPPVPEPPTGPVAHPANASTAVPSSLVVEDVVEDPFLGDLDDDDAPTAIRPPESFFRPPGERPPGERPPTAASPPEEPARGVDPSAAADAGFSEIDDETPPLGEDIVGGAARGADVPVDAVAQDDDDDDVSLDDLLDESPPVAAPPRPGTLGAPKSASIISRRVVAVAERQRTIEHGIAAAVASKSPAPEVSDDDDPALSGLIEGVADLSVLRIPRDESGGGEAFASPPLRHDPQSDLGPETLGVRSEVFTSTPEPAASLDLSHATTDATGTPDVMEAGEADAGQEVGQQTQIIRPMASERAVRRIVDGGSREPAPARRGLRIGAVDSAEHTALRDVPIAERNEPAHEVTSRRPTSARQIVASSPRALMIGADAAHDVPPHGSDPEETQARARAPAHAEVDDDGLVENSEGASADGDAYDEELHTDAVQALADADSTPEPSSLLDDAGLSSMESEVEESGVDESESAPDDGSDFESATSGETDAGARESPYARGVARRGAPGGDSSSVELISDDAVVRGRRVDPSSLLARSDESVLSALSADDSGFEGSDVGEASFEEPTGAYDSAGERLAAESADYPLPSSLVEGAASSDVADPEATAYVPHPASHLVSSQPGGEASGWSGEGTANVDGFTKGESTGLETRGESLQGRVRALGKLAHDRHDGPSDESGDSRVSGRPAPRALPPSSAEDNSISTPRGRGTSGGAELRAKARRHFDQALRDHEEGRESRARMNAKLASIYDPDNEEYRAAVVQWGGEPRRPATTGKPREVELYEEAQRLESEDEIDGAIMLLREGIAINPHIAAFHNRLGVILALRRHEYAEAAQAVRRAVELEPDNLHYKSNYGKIVSKAKMKGQLAGPA